MLKRKKLIWIIFVLLFAIILYLVWTHNRFTPLDAKKFGLICKIDRTCGNLVGIDCYGAVDGPYYYVDRHTEQVVSRCGGYCMNPSGCTNCPPAEWTCN